jgi:ATP-dependent Clp endopeptidase proteolytic subunit ClpP
MKNWYRFKNLDDGTVEIFIYDVIVDYAWDEDETTAKGFVDELKAAGSKTPVDLHINSPGGSVFAGLAIYNAIKRHQGKVSVYIDGLAASIASVVAMAGDTVIIPENALMMIHDPLALAMGSAEELRKVADSLDKAKTGIISAYRSRTNLAEDTLSELMSAETWLSAEDALNFGFADQYEEALPMAALASLDAFDLSQFRNIPDMLHRQNVLRKASASNPINNHTGEETMTVEEFKEKYPQTYDAVYGSGIEAGRQTERERIKAVENQLMPGHEDLMDKLKYDGETTGEQAAVLILAAEKEIRQTMLKNLKDDAVEPVEPAEPADPGANERIMLVQAMAGGINKK